MIELKHVTVSYLVGDIRNIGLKDYFVRKLKGTYSVKNFVAVNDVSFKLEKGDMLGIVGSNGAGKSTLLKVVSGIMRPTCGTVKVKGNVAALLELGSGFDGDLTVKENTYLRGALLGYSRSFMDEMYSEIISFAELSDFQESPFRTLSSGMMARLAFSIACLVKPDVLILDEVLSVGDGAFQRKSEAKMQETLQSGVTTLFVSHSIDQVERVCNKVLWLDHGRQIAFGTTQEVCSQYQKFLSGK